MERDSASQFPSATSETFALALSRTPKIEIIPGGEVDSVGSQISVLHAYLSHLSDNMFMDPQEFLSGAQRMSGVLGQLAEEGLGFPEVTAETIETFHEELRTAGDVMRPELLQAGSMEELVDIYTSMLSSMEFNFPDPEKYQDENPAIMTWVQSLDMDAARGALIVYELKRRQFLNNQAEQLFKSRGFGSLIKRILRKG